MKTDEAVARARRLHEFREVYGEHIAPAGWHYGLTQKEQWEMLPLALANDTVIHAVVLCCGFPPSQPNTPDLQEFGSYIHDLAIWTQAARAQLFRLWGIDDDEYERNVIFRRGFDECLRKWYALAKYKDYKIELEHERENFKIELEHEWKDREIELEHEWESFKTELEHEREDCEIELEHEWEEL